ncbi:hypothetical protein SMICM304S_02658 [Streptomyces microflavus]
MNTLPTSAFLLPDHLSPKADPALIAADEQHFAAIARTLDASIAELTARLDAERRAPGGTGRQAMDRDAEIHRLTARLRTLRRFGLDLCLGHMAGEDGSAPVYVGRLGLTDSEGRRLLVDWRSPAAEPFFGATHANPERVGLDRVALASLTVNYRTPEEVMAEAEPVIRAVLPDANVPTSIRTGGRPVRRGPVAERDAVLEAWLDAHTDGIACVIGDPTFRATPRVRSLTPELSKGLEFDLVVLVAPEAFGEGIEGAVDRYVAMTRATQELVVLTSS